LMCSCLKDFSVLRHSAINFVKNKLKNSMEDQ
jgi:hypothetical protein